MRPGNGKPETEIKLRVQNIAALRRRLKQLRARQVSPRTYEFNTLFDAANHYLYRQGKIIRIRVERRGASKKPRLSVQEAILTFKGPSEGGDSQSKPVRANRYKIRQEIELCISDARQMERILAHLGLRPSFHYEKYRTTYVLPDVKGVQIEFDETPVGLFLELEGSTTAIDRAASQLGYSRDDYVTASYGQLHKAALRRRGLRWGDLLFNAAKKSR